MDRQNKPKIYRTEQDVANSGFDEQFQVPVVELLAYNPNGGGPGIATLERVMVNDDGELVVTGGSGGSSGGLTDAQLRATPVPVDIGGASVSVNASDIQIGAVELKDATGANRAAIDAGGAVKVDNSGVTQPVSAASLPLPTGAATATKQDTGNTSLASIDTKLPASPAAEHTAANSPHATRLSDGAAFYKATTPSDTQPVSAASLPLPTGAATETTLAALNTKIPSSPATDRATAASPAAARLSDGAAFYKATTPSDTQPVSIATLPALAAGTNNIGDVDVLTLPAIPAGTNRIGSVRLVDSADADQTSVKGTQTSRFVGVQKSIDAGRSQVMLFWDFINAASGTTALTNFTEGTRGAAALAAANNLQVSAGKTLRIQQIIVTVAATSATRFTLRPQIRQAAAVANTSPVIWQNRLGIEAIGTLAADTPVNTYTFDIPDGLEVAAAQQITFTINAAAVQGKASLALIGFEY